MSPHPYNKPDSVHPNLWPHNIYFVTILVLAKEGVFACWEPEILKETDKAGSVPGSYVNRASRPNKNISIPCL